MRPFGKTGIILNEPSHQSSKKVYIQKGRYVQQEDTTKRSKGILFSCKWFQDHEWIAYGCNTNKAYYFYCYVVLVKKGNGKYSCELCN